MIDYLESAAEGNAGALLAAELQLEAALAGLWRQRAVQDDADDPPEGEWPVWGELPVQEEWLKGQDWTLESEAQWTVRPEETGERDGALPLAAEWKRLELALAGVVQDGAGGLERVSAGTGRRPEQMDMAETAGYGRRNGTVRADTAGTVSDYDRTAPGNGEAGGRRTGRLFQTGVSVSAERLDQLFRRDSRRYDGGFFLY